MVRTIGSTSVPGPTVYRLQPGSSRRPHSRPLTHLVEGFHALRRPRRPSSIAMERGRRARRISSIAVQPSAPPPILRGCLGLLASAAVADLLAAGTHVGQVHGGRRIRQASGLRNRDSTVEVPPWIALAPGVWSERRIRCCQTPVRPAEALASRIHAWALQVRRLDGAPSILAAARAQSLSVFRPLRSCRYLQ